MIVQELAKVMAVTVSRGKDDIDEELMYVTMASLLVEFPPDVIKDACISWMKCEKWRPSLAEIRERCHQRFRARDSLRAVLRLALDRASSPDGQGGGVRFFPAGFHRGRLPREETPVSSN